MSRADDVPGPPADDAEWFVAFTDPRREKTLQQMLKARSFETYLPVMTVTRRSGRVKHALFPRYVFVGLKPGRKLFDLRKTPHLGGIVKVAGKPYQVAPEILKGLRGAEAAGVYDFTDERLAELEVAARVERHMAARARALRDLVPNARVRIVDGPFRTFAGRVVELMLPDRVMIGIKLFGAEHPIPMEIGDVELARRAEP